MNSKSIDIRKHSLKRLLVSCRESVAYEEVGLPRPMFGRIAGLSQEAAARLAGVSTHWWCDLENGRIHSPHAALLDSVAVTLRMNEQQRADLYFLATGHPPATPSRALTIADDNDIELVMRADPNPAVLTDHLGNTLTGNDAVKRWFPGLTDGLDSETNIVLWFFGAVAEKRVANVGEVQAWCVGQLKAAVLRYPTDGTVTALVERLAQLPDAARLWQTEYATTSQSAARLQIRHPDRDEIHDLVCATTEFANGKRLHVGYPPTGLN